MRAEGLQPTGGSRVWIAGIDGCRGGWFALLLKRACFAFCSRSALCPVSDVFRAFESPELAFFALAGQPMRYKKKTLPIGASGQP
jgi:predicted RNase H-like nuclease